MTRLPAGIITVLNTPFTQSDEIDAESLVRNVRRAVAAGVSGILVPALAAEVYELTEAERHRIVQTVVDAVDGTVFVIGSATARTADERFRHARSLVDLGCDAILVALDATDGEAVVDELVSLSNRGSVPLLLQDWDPAGEGFSLDLIAMIADEVESLLGLKIEVVPAGPKFTAIRERFGRRFHLSGGWTVLQLIEALDRGVDAFMPTALHEIYTAIEKRYRAGDRGGAVELFRALLPVLAFSNQHLYTSIHFFKHLLHAEGIYSSARCRVSEAHFDAYHRRVADELIGYAIELTRKVAGDGG